MGLRMIVMKSNLQGDSVDGCGRRNTDDSEV